jgi:hypothetical protein
MTQSDDETTPFAEADKPKSSGEVLAEKLQKMDETSEKAKAMAKELEEPQDK